jgi:3-oxoadipate enol-lactonase
LSKPTGQGNISRLLESWQALWRSVTPERLSNSVMEEAAMLLPLAGRCLYYDIVGRMGGQVVCFAHSLAADSGMWIEQVPPLLEAGFQVLRIDMRGHGGSSPVAGNYDMAQLYGDVLEVMNALNIDRVHFVGLSIGGMLAQGFGLDHPKRIRSLMLCDSQPASPPDAATRWGGRIAEVQKAGSCLPLGDGTMQRWFTEAFRKKNPVRWRQIRDTVISTSAQGYIGCAAAIQNFDYRPRLPGLRIPTLIVCGADDPGAPPGESRHIAGLLPDGRYEEIADARHLPNVERPEAFNPLMLGWLQAH